jgi:hypothetical protein
MLTECSLPRTLKTLDVSDNPITDVGLQRLLSRSRLEWLNVSHTQIGEKGVDFIESVKELSRVDAAGVDVPWERWESLGRRRRGLEIRLGYGEEDINVITESVAK